jgi:hypothetical protein
VVEMVRDDGVCLLFCFGMKLEGKWKGRGVVAYELFLPQSRDSFASKYLRHV